MKLKTITDQELKIERRFTKPDINPLDEVEYEIRSSKITEPDGTVVFEMDNIEVPKSWSQLATDIVASKYFKRALVPITGKETSVKQLITRVSQTIRQFGEENNYFNSPKDAQAFEDELTHLLITQKGAFNSPVWFNCGLFHKYGIKGNKPGTFFYNLKTNQVEECEDSYSHPQSSACQPYHALINTTKGLIPIGKIIEENLIGIGVYDGSGITRINAVKANGKKQVYKIKLRDGFFIEATSDHLICAHKKRKTKKFEWKKIEDLKIGEYMRVYTNSIPKDNIINPQLEAEAALAGWLQTDGFVGQYKKGTNTSLTIEFITVNDDEFEWINSNLDIVFPYIHKKVRKVRSVDKNLKIRRIRLYGEVLRGFVEKYELLKRRNEIRVPPLIWSAPNRTLLAYLKSIFQAEGYSSQRKNSARIGLAMISKDFVQEIQILLIKLGIYSRLRRKREKRKDREDTYEIDISIGSERKEFLEKISFISKNKETKAQQTLLLKNLKQCPKIRYQQVVSIEPIGIMDVYDIQTESEHYLTNSVLVHNCFIQRIDDSLDSIYQLITNESKIFKFGSGCTSGNSFIFTDKFGLIKIRDLFQKYKDREIKEFDGKGRFIDISDENIYTASLNKDGSFKWDLIEKIWDYKLKKEDKLKIKLNNGARVIVSAWHPFMFWDGSRIIKKRADQLEEGDSILGVNSTILPLLNEQEIKINWNNRYFRKIEENSIILDNDLFWIIGYFMGDGSLGKRSSFVKGKKYSYNRLRFHDETLETLNKVKYILEKKFNAIVKIRKDNRGSKGHTLQTFSRKAGSFFEVLFGIGSKTYTLKMPKFIYSSGINGITAFLAGLLDSDGYITKDGKAVYSSASRDFASEVAVLSSLIGCGGGIIIDKYTNSATIIRKSSNNEIVELLANNLVNNKRKLNLINSIKRNHRSSKCIPLKKEILEEFLTLPEKTAQWLNFEVNDEKFHAGRLMYEGIINSQKLIKIIKASQIKDKLTQFLTNIAESVSFVTGIEKISDDIDFYDLTVEKNTNYLAGENALTVISNTGSNFSSLRGVGEKLSGGGFSSGLMSYLKILDRSAAAVKSGGITRRAAKMVVLDMDHPEIEDYIMWKFKEEEKAQVLIANGYQQDFNGEAYQTVSGQNSNNSVMIPNSFMQAVIEDKEWHTIERTTGKIRKTYKARELMKMISKAAWRCADPGVMFYDTMNKWHTCPNTEHIHSTNPCAEYNFIDDTACNLASINLMKFIDDKGIFDIENFKHACKIFFIAQEILVDFSSYPTKSITQRSHEFRTIGLGHANLGTLLMVQGIPYDSPKGRTIAAAITAILTGQAYETSAQIASFKQPFERFEENKEPMLKVMNMHRDATYKIDVRYCPNYLLETAREQWDKTVALGEEYGYKNAQATVIAPTGTISLLMDCDTTGIEPEFSLIKWKKLAGGGYFKIVNQSIKKALENLGYLKNEINEIIEYVLENGNIENAPYIKQEHLAIFDCANKNSGGKRFIDPMGHVNMMAAVQPFVAGAISKTINLPNEATVEDIENIYFEAWRVGLKCIALYRDGCKLSQPLNTKLEQQKSTELIERGTQKKLPYKRIGTTISSKISENKIFIRTGEYEDRKVGEIFIDMHKAGSSYRSLMNCFAIAVSMGLQYGVPLEKYVDMFTFTRFEPSGLTNHPNIRSATSVIDFIFRVLGMEYLGRTDFVHIPPSIDQETPKKNITTNNEKEIQTKLPEDKTSSKEKHLSDMLGDAPLCDQCGHTTIRNGSCYKCLNCGNSMGCS